MFHCQRDSFARELETEVVSCKPVTRKLEVNGKKQPVVGCEVVCKDTVIFPEGGGQNTDKGTISGVPVVSVTRLGSTAVHFLSSPLQLVEGDKVVQVVDWTRRWDNMQQHSGQHLVSAVLEKEHNINTMSWWMAENSDKKVGVSYIELDQPVPDTTMSAVEDRCNSVIQSALPMTVNTYQVGDPALDEAHTRGLPADQTGPVRLVSIPGVDSNLCCGTHVSCTSQLQVVKLVNMETKKGKHWLYFLVGSRVTSYLQSCLARERTLTKILNNAAEEHIELVDKMQKSLKVAQKDNSNLLKELAVQEANKIKQSSPKPLYCIVHRKEGDSDFISAFLKELDENDMLCVVTTGDEKTGPGQLVVTGEAKLVQEIGKKLCTLLDGKGGGKGTRFNAKINNLKIVAQIENIVKAHVAEI
eukprot:GFUD01035546.1.p1 GENE.GFUD01035546.1~~GFUD01035546.1.p1  ORF type:complete len:414 (+),score=163.75 GFUD01035546.1:43-1284(+)